mmetsp:Transcript_17625/g.44792  ORF Transcript_17625/g.44792 Transcript_17625/m.44792 type:complete len:261 (+) Transcript_17625:174-956(+)
MSRFKYDCPYLIETICSRAMRGMEDWKAQNISNLAHALAELGYFDQSLFEEIAKQAERISMEGNEQSVTNTLWAFAIVGVVAKNESAVKLLWNNAIERPGGEFLEVHWRMLALSRLFAKSEGVDLGSEHSRFLKMATSCVVEGSSEFEKAVAKDLVRHGYDGFEREVSPFEGVEGGELLKIDIAWRKDKVALELDGPTHFLTALRGGSSEIRLDGPSKAKTRLLESHGWSVHRLSYLDHIALDSKGEVAWRHYLRDIFEA